MIARVDAAARARLALLFVLTSLAGCHSTNAPSRQLREVSLPDLSRMDPPVQTQTRERYSTLTQRRDAGASDADLGAAFGEYAMILQAAEYYDAAEPAYLNAQTLMPGDVRWPYYLGHLYKSRGETAKSIQSFTRALELRPTDVSALIWLGRLYLEQGQPDAAEPLFTRAQAQAPQAIAVLSGLGQVALAKRDYRRAVDLLEQSLTIDPGAASVHSPLAMAYRGLGDSAKAEAHLKLWRNTDILVPDPMRMELDLALQSGLSYELRGVRALEARDFTTAVDMFRKGIPLTKSGTQLSRSLHHKLGTALFLTGDVRGAVEQFEQVTREAPEGFDEPSAKANYSLGVVLVSAGRTTEAIERFSRAITHNPNYLEARMALADALRRSGRVEASLAQYAEAVRINPRAAEARFGYAMALVRLRRYREARDWLTESTRAQPDRPELALALARILAAAPDPGVRDGSRAMTILQELFKGTKTTQLGETMAMAAAEVGNFQEAAAIQRGVMEASQRAGLDAEVRRMAVNLRLYERGQPCRTPWADDDPVHSPGPPVTPGLLDASNTARPSS